MKVLSLMFTIILLIRFRIWFFRQVFSRIELQIWSKAIHFFSVVLLVWALAVYERGISALWWTSLKTSLEISTGMLFFLRCVVVITVLICYRGFQKEKKIWFQILIGVWLLGISIWACGLVFWGESTQIIRFLPYYLILAHTEELFKFSLAHLEEGKQSQPSISSLLAFALLTGMSFALVENLLAFWVLLAQGSQLSTGFLMWRWGIAVMIHIVATWSIAMLLLKLRHLPRYLKYVLALSLGIAIHSIYNRGLAFGVSSVSFVLAIGGFAGLTYMLYHLDELYLPKE